MKKKFKSQSTFLNVRIVVGFVFCLVGVLIALGSMGFYLATSEAQAQPGQVVASLTVKSPNGPDVVRLVGPVCMNTNLRELPYIPPTPGVRKPPLVSHQWRKAKTTSTATSRFAQVQALIIKIVPPLPMMPPPLFSFDGINFVESGIDEGPPDTNGDVGPKHYLEMVNDSFKVFDKNGNVLSGPTTYNSFFALLGNGNPCGADQNEGDPIVLYDQIADRWVITDFAHPTFPGDSFWECIGVSQTGDPVAGGWCLYALQQDPEHPNRLGDYPKFGLWPDAYYLTMNEFTDGTTFNGVRVYALDRASMIGGGPTNAIGFTIEAAPEDPGFSLVPAGFRTGDPPPVGRQEFLVTIDVPDQGGVSQTEVKGWLCHVDFVNPDNSTLGIEPGHSPNSHITVSPFIIAATDSEELAIVPQKGTTQKLDTLGTRVMTPLVYQNRNGTESLWADHTVILNYPDGPTAIRWYQLDVTGGNFPATPLQQQDWSNGNDGIWRWMPSIAVDENGNTAICYSASSESMFPSIRCAGRFANDPLNDLGQGEAIMTNGSGSQTGTNRWGDYTMTTIDPADGVSFWHANEYYPATSGQDWYTRIGKFRFPRAAPTPRQRPTPAPRPTLPPR
jgi:hypothetical protein